MAPNEFATFLDVVGRNASMQAALNQTTSADEFAAVAAGLARAEGLDLTEAQVLRALSDAAIPDAPAALSDDQLSQVAGGDGCSISCLITHNRVAETFGCNVNLKLNWNINP